MQHSLPQRQAPAHLRADLLEQRHAAKLASDRRLAAAVVPPPLLLALQHQLRRRGDGLARPDQLVNSTGCSRTSSAGREAASRTSAARRAAGPRAASTSCESCAYERTT